VHGALHGVEPARSPILVTSPVPWRQRLAIAVGCGLLAGLRAGLISETAVRPSDFSQVWFAARTLLAGQDPYAVIGPGRAFDWPAQLFYPLPAAVAAMPLAPFSAFWAPVIFALLAGGLFAWALAEHGYRPLLAFLSAPVVFAAEVVQWSPLLAAATVLTRLGVLFIAKPTIGEAMFAARPSWWAVAGAVLLLAVSFALEPHWITGWRAALATQREVHAHVYHIPHRSRVTRKALTRRAPNRRSRR